MILYCSSIVLLFARYGRYEAVMAVFSFCFVLAHTGRIDEDAFQSRKRASDK